MRRLATRYILAASLLASVTLLFALSRNETVSNATAKYSDKALDYGKDLIAHIDGSAQLQDRMDKLALELTNSTAYFDNYPEPGRPFVQVNNFGRCSVLNGATFYSDIVIKYTNETSHESADLAIRDIPNSDTYLRDAIEKRAEWIFGSSYFTEMEERRPSTNDPEALETFPHNQLMRLSCSLAAFGNQQNWHNISAERVLRTFSPNFFPFIAYQPDASRALGTKRGIKRHVKVAHAVMLHDNPVTAQEMLAWLDTDDTFTLVHIDRNAKPELRQAVEAWIKERKTDRVQLLPEAECFGMGWAHVSLVWAQLQLFFRIQDTVEFDYVVNLSGEDFPLKSPSTVHKALSRLPSYSWIYFLDAPKQMTWRMQHMHVCKDPPHSEQRCMDKIVIDYNPRTPPNDLFPVQYKQSQWMILHRSAVEYLRYAEKPRYLLAFMESQLAPDEAYFSVALLNSDYLRRTLPKLTGVNQPLVPDSKRLIYWETHESHPRTMDITYKEFVRLNRCLFYTRKFNVEDQTDMRNKRVLKMLREIYDEDEDCEPVVRNYEAPLQPVDGW